MEHDSENALMDRVDWARFRSAMLICVTMLILYATLLGLFALLVGTDTVVCFQFMYFRGAVGIPSAIIAAVTIVTLLASSIRGDFTIKLWGLTLEGPSAPITMWVVCFLALTLALYVLLPSIEAVAALPPRIAAFCTIAT